jgi:chaperonin GroEL
MMEGVVPGGGLALLSCRQALQQQLEKAADTDERAAYRILLTALEAPLRTLVSNAGYDSSEVLAQINLAGPGYGFDVVSGQVVDMIRAGIWDAAVVQKSAAYAAIASGALALTIDVLVHRNGQAQRASTHTPSKRKRL